MKSRTSPSTTKPDFIPFDAYGPVICIPYDTPVPILLEPGLLVSQGSAGGERAGGPLPNLHIFFEERHLRTQNGCNF